MTSYRISTLLVFSAVLSGCISPEQLARRNAEMVAIRPVERERDRQFEMAWPRLAKGMSPQEVCRLLGITSFDGISPDQVGRIVEVANGKAEKAGRNTSERDFYVTSTAEDILGAVLAPALVTHGVSPIIPRNQISLRNGKFVASTHGHLLTFGPNGLDDWH